MYVPENKIYMVLMDLLSIVIFFMYLFVWIKLVPLVDEEYQFLIRVLMMYVPVFFGLNQLQEYEEQFSDKIKNKIKNVVAQIYSMDTQSTIAIIYNNGNIEFIDKSKNIKQKKQPKNWYDTL